MQAYKFNAKNDDEALKAIRYFKLLGFIQAFDKGFIPKSWIEIPAGATFATGKTKPIFRKDGFYWDDEDPIGGDGIPFWRETSVNLSNAETCGLEVVWMREEPSISIFQS